MSKRFIIRLTARDPSDVPGYMEAVNAACPPKASLDVHIECTPEVPNSAPQRVDEALETAINHDLSGRLDRLAALAQAVHEHQADEQRREGIDQILKRAERVSENRGRVRRWFAEAVRLSWQATIGVVIEILLRSPR